MESLERFVARGCSDRYRDCVISRTPSGRRTWTLYSAFHRRPTESVLSPCLLYLRLERCDQLRIDEPAGSLDRCWYRPLVYATDLCARVCTGTAGDLAA